MSFEISGSLLVKEDIVDISSNFRKREFVIEVVNERNTDWNDFIKFQLTQDRCQLLDPFQFGEKIKVSFNIKGRKWEKDGRVNYITNLEAWRIESVVENKDSAMVPPPFTENDIPPEEEGFDDLPF